MFDYQLFRRKVKKSGDNTADLADRSCHASQTRRADLLHSDTADDNTVSTSRLKKGWQYLQQNPQTYQE